MTRSFSEPGPGAVQPRQPARFETLDGAAWNQAETGERGQTSEPGPKRQPPDGDNLRGGPAIKNLFLQPGNHSGRAASSETTIESPASPAGETGSQPGLLVETQVVFHENASTRTDEGPQHELLFPEPAEPPGGVESPMPAIVRLERVEQLLQPAFGIPQEPLLREPSGRERPFPEIPQAPIPEVHVSIGRIEVHAPPAATLPARPAAPHRAPQPARPVRSLDDYLAGRQEGGTAVPRRR